MDLHSAVSSAIGGVNPFIPVVLRTSSGYAYSLSGDGTRVPVFADPVTVQAQVQAFTNKEIEHLNNMNIGGILKKLYIHGKVESLDRKDGTGGDLITWDGDTWLVVHVLENWPDWTAAVLQKQLTSM
jgi:hypothetical protein